MAVTYTLPCLSIAMLDWRDSSIIVLSDTSTYDALPASGTYNFQITTPEYDTISATFTPGSVNVYKCADLGVTCSDTDCTPLPDGIYTIQYSVQPITGQLVTIELKFIKIDQIKCKYEKVFLKVDLECACYDPNQEKYLIELKRIKLYINGSVAECNRSNYKLSYKFYTMADTMLDKISCKFPNSKFKPCNC